MSSIIQWSRHSAGAVLKVCGPDALSFLQGQFTQELRSRTPRLCAYGLWLSQKGKVMGDSWALRLNENSWILVAARMPANSLLSRLDSYLIADEVELVDDTPAWQLIRIDGSDTAQWMRGPDRVEVPEGEWRAFGGGYVWRVPSGGVLWLCPTGAQVTLPGDPQTEVESEWSRFERGTLAIPGDLGEADLPNEAGLEESAISYTKGCYLGQEVMARLKSMGQVRRRLMRVRGTGEMPPVGAELQLEGKRLGEFRGGVAREGSYIGMAMVSLLVFRADVPLAWNGQPLVLEALR